ncbi:hypothetical protein LG198_14075 [Methylobacillus arboreus]|uniref:hypothetical protein n=1 Tax=Methylobacillus arboreus TaxID=755170 RepID=UPI001E2D452B|nr:hypothetical protein [Methylobacillus arboreus]MCB5191857.1 hypothetical protein [Methylobacillus arboreus]
MKLPTTKPFMVGRYLITPIFRINENGRFTASVSIRSGQGSSTHCRIYSFEPEFVSSEKALNHAASQGHVWLSNPQAFA